MSVRHNLFWGDRVVIGSVAEQPCKSSMEVPGVALGSDISCAYLPKWRFRAVCFSCDNGESMGVGLPAVVQACVDGRLRLRVLDRFPNG